MALYIDEEVPENSIHRYFMFSGFIGDLVQQTRTARLTTHTAEKGCTRCFLMGTITLDGDDLKTMQWHGMHHEAKAEVLVPQPSDFLEAIPVTREHVCLTQLDADENVIFDSRDYGDNGDDDAPAEPGLKIDYELYDMRRQCADDTVATAAVDHPIPPPLSPGRSQSQKNARREGEAPILSLSQVFRCMNG